MRDELLDRYQTQVLPFIEEPIRELMLGLWQLPIIVDTDTSCCGHIVSDRVLKSYGDRVSSPKERFWYPQGLQLGVAFSLESALKGQVEEFREQMLTIGKDIELYLDESERGYRDLDGRVQRVQQVHYASEFPEKGFQKPKKDFNRSIQRKHDRLIRFWEAVAGIIRQHNSFVHIPPIADKDFTKVISHVDQGEARRYNY